MAEVLGMTVERLRREMSAREFAQWCIFLSRTAQRRQLGQ